MPALKNPRIERFAQALFTSDKRYPASAGLTVGYCPAYSRSLAARPDVRMRLEELKEASASKLTMSVKEREERLSEIARQKIDVPVTAAQVTGAIAELNKMGGDYAPEKHIIAQKVIFEVRYQRERKRQDDTEGVDCPRRLT